jgi:hypothetical protein
MSSDHAPLLYAAAGIKIFCDRNKLFAIKIRNMGDFGIPERIEKSYSYIEDLHELPMRGLLRLAEEFLEELRK